MGLTDNQARLLRLVMDAVQAHGRPPSLRELVAAYGGRSTNGMYRLLRGLTRAGYVEFGDDGRAMPTVTGTRGRSRTLKVLRGLDGEPVRLAYLVVTA